jgi:hypothetical protein
MSEAVKGLGIVSKAYYNNDPSVIDRKPKKGIFTNKILFEGSFNECLEKKKGLLKK